MKQWQLYQLIFWFSTLLLVLVGGVSLWRTPENWVGIVVILLICLAGIFWAGQQQIPETKSAQVELLDVPPHLLEKVVDAKDIINTFPLVVGKLKVGTRCQLVTLILFDPQKQWLTFAALDRPRPQLKSGMRLRIHEASGSAHILDGEPSIIPYLGDYLNYPIDKNLFDAGYRSQITLPLRVGNEIVGALSLSWKEAEAYNLEQLPLISQIADTFALAIERTRLLESQQQQNARNETLHQMNHLITGSLELDDVLQTIAHQVVELMQADYSNVMLFEPPDLLMWLANYQLPNEIAFISQQKTDTGVNGWVATHKRPLLIPNLQTDGRSAYPELARKYGIVGYLGVPMLIEDDLIGVLNISTSEPTTYTEDDVLLMVSFAEQAAVAIDNARRYNKAQNQAVQLEAQMVVRTADLETATERLKHISNERAIAQQIAQENQQALQLLNTIHATLLNRQSIYDVGSLSLRQMQTFIPFAYAVLFKFDDVQDKAEVIATHMIDNQYLQIGYTISVQSFYPYTKLKQGQIVSVFDLSQMRDMTHIDTIWQTMDIKGYTLFPIRIQNELLGAIQIDITQDKTLTQRHIRLITQVSQAFAMAIEYSHYIHLRSNQRETLPKASRAIEQLRTNWQILQDIATAPELPALFERIVNLVCDRFGYYHAQVYTLRNGILHIEEATGEAGKQMKQKQHHILLTSERSLVAQAALTESPIRVGNVKENPYWLPNELLPETQAELAIPIIWQKAVLGVLDVQSTQVNSLDEEDELLLLNLCGQIALAIQNQHLMKLHQS